MEKLKDPRWQKKRLEILSRDNWTCQYCGAIEATLHVHHLLYNKEPWDAKSEYLITICESCHESEHNHREGAEKALLHALKIKGFSYSSVTDIATAFYYLNPFHTHDVMASIIEWAFNNEDIMQELSNRYFEYLLVKNNITNP